MFRVITLIFIFSFTAYANSSNDDLMDLIIKAQKKLDYKQAGRSDFIEAEKDKISSLEYEINEITKIISNESDYGTAAQDLDKLNSYLDNERAIWRKNRIKQRTQRKREAKAVTEKNIKKIKSSSMNRNDLEEQLKLLKQSMSDNEIRDSEIKSKLRIILDEKKEYATELRSKVKRVTQGKELLKMSPDELAMQRVKKAREQGKKAKEQAKIAKRKAEILAQEKAFVVLGQCDIGNTVYHREVWNTKTSSGNVLADMAFGAATKETFIITYEAVVESFLGNKVKTIINDYKIQQTVGGGFLNQRTYRKYDIASHADKYIGKTQFYDKARCS